MNILSEIAVSVGVILFVVLFNVLVVYLPFRKRVIARLKSAYLEFNSEAGCGSAYEDYLDGVYDCWLSHLSLSEGGFADQEEFHASAVSSLTRHVKRLQGDHEELTKELDRIIEDRPPGYVAEIGQLNIAIAESSERLFSLNENLGLLRRVKLDQPALPEQSLAA